VRRIRWFVEIMNPKDLLDIDLILPSPLAQIFALVFFFTFKIFTPHPPRNGYNDLQFPVSRGRLFALSSISCRPCADHVSNCTL
jgi:hypothetical protein